MYAGWLSHCAGKCAHVRVESEKSRGVWRLAGKPIDFFSGQVCVREETDNPVEKKGRILACLFRPSRSTYTQDVCEQLRPTCSINLPCHDMYKCSCSSRQSNFKTLFGHCFSLGRRGNHVRVRACNVPSECKKYDWLRLLIIVMPKRTEGNPTFFPEGC